MFHGLNPPKIRLQRDRRRRNRSPPLAIIFPPPARAKGGFMKKLFLVVLLGLMSTFLTADDKPASNTKSPAAPPAPPAAKKVHTENHVNGGNLVDDYGWLRDKKNPDVAQYLEAENTYADAIMKPTEALQQKL